MPLVQVVAPKRAALADANKRLEGANKKLSGIRAKVKELKVGTASGNSRILAPGPHSSVRCRSAGPSGNAGGGAGRCHRAEECCCGCGGQAHAHHTSGPRMLVATCCALSALLPRMQAERTAAKAQLAQRLITGLASEYTRWTESIQQMAATEGNLVGDVLLSSAFVTYAGVFNAELRRELVEVSLGRFPSRGRRRRAGAIACFDGHSECMVGWLFPRCGCRRSGSPTCANDAFLLPPTCAH